MNEYVQSGQTKRAPLRSQYPSLCLSWLQSMSLLLDFSGQSLASALGVFKRILLPMTSAPAASLAFSTKAKASFHLHQYYQEATGIAIVHLSPTHNARAHSSVSRTHLPHTPGVLTLVSDQGLGSGSLEQNPSSGTHCVTLNTSLDLQGRNQISHLYVQRGLNLVETQ